MLLDAVKNGRTDEVMVGLNQLNTSGEVRICHQRGGLVHNIVQFLQGYN